MIVFTDDRDMCVALAQYAMSAAVPAEIAGKLQPVAVQGAPGDRICQSAELLYAHYDLLDTAGKTVCGQCFAFMHRMGWYDRERSQAIVDAVLRDTGEPGTWPDPADDPDPQVHLRDGGVNWKDGVTLSLEVVQQRTWDAVKKLRDEKEDGIAPSPFGGVQSDDRSKIKVNGLATMAMLSKQQQAAWQADADAATAAGEPVPTQPTPFSEEFTLADNSLVLLDADMAIALGMSAAQYVSAVHTRARELRGLIFAADATVESVEAIDITTGWPTEG